MNKTGDYFARRQHLIYYRYIDAIVRGLAHDANSLLDVGTHDATYLEAFDWITVRHALDLRKPYSSYAVKGIQADFWDFQPERKYDFCTCFQTLEHILDAAGFAQKLISISDRVLVSVPFCWPEGSHYDHVHDPVDLDKLNKWFGRKASYHVVVTEPLNASKKASRLISYYHLSDDMRPLHEYRTILSQVEEKQST
jgi:hypothetical protein